MGAAIVLLSLLLGKLRLITMAASMSSSGRPRGPRPRVSGPPPRAPAYYKEVLLRLRQQVVDETQLQFNAMNVGAFQIAAG